MDYIWNVMSREEGEHPNGIQNNTEQRQMSVEDEFQHDNEGNRLIVPEEKVEYESYRQSDIFKSCKYEDNEVPPIDNDANLKGKDDKDEIHLDFVEKK
mmetsp:Transcript_42405/g.40656  ORF Transcript_42405/g.40656 Transcript_42405/m.40656 type:complete len:98 (+) Transcript_42405:1273-1566(+)|eukprot:CAMPEP_0170546714 /NCGR_PEP_ID=MMETSP0211-20121228/5050_1 /TAXON_ID=311385 /ORGANISM="Pseudokeronopsis sp., Strain OXSARD2" /LENGTH=97 /DNA_ID=CAMNT_0010851307 /DNA_START=1209 /DNA_END=1502 /DNA_ORIENTATION=+